MDNTIINCAESGSIYNGVSNCGKFDTGDIRGQFAFNKGLTFPNDETFLTKFVEAFRKNQMIYLSAYDYRQAHEENQMNTSSLGNMQLQRLGKPMTELDITASFPRYIE